MRVEENADTVPCIPSLCPEAKRILLRFSQHARLLSSWLTTVTLIPLGPLANEENYEVGSMRKLC